MNILFVTHYYEPDSGAAANRLTQLANQLQQRGHTLTVLTTMPHYPHGIIPKRYRRRWTVIETRGGIRVIQVWLWATPSPKISRRLLSQISFMLACALRGMFIKQPDVIFIENQPVFTGLAGWFISKIKRVPYVLNVSDYWPEYLVVTGVLRENSLLYRIFKALTNLTQRHAAVITAMLDDLLTKIEARIGPVKRSRIIYNAVDLQRYQPNPEAETHFREKFALGNNPLVTFLGGLGPHIDLEAMLGAARHFAGREDVTFVFVGSGAQQNALTAALAQPDFAHCRWIDWIGGDDLPGFWSASTITYWALHHNELDKMRFQAKLYEALASGTPAVIAVDGLMSDFFQRTLTGVAVKPGDARALALAIDTLLNDPQGCVEMGQRARHYAETHFDLSRQVDAYEAALNECR